MRTAIIVLALVMTAATIWQPDPAPASSARYCGIFHAPTGARIAVQIESGGTTCHHAKVVLRAYDRYVSPSRCHSSACPKTVRSYHCSAATPGAFPRLSSCKRRHTLIVAYSTAE
ncbi:MAG: hypothetical protein ACR2LA_06805 [Acidimicrobiales bacterium]